MLRGLRKREVKVLISEKIKKLPKKRNGRLVCVSMQFGHAIAHKWSNSDREVVVQICAITQTHAHVEALKKIQRAERIRQASISVFDDTNCAPKQTSVTASAAIDTERARRAREKSDRF